MKTIESAVDPQEAADMERVSSLLSQGLKIDDPDLLRRVHARADVVREEAFRKFGVQNIGVAIIRELRDAE